MTGPVVARAASKASPRVALRGEEREYQGERKGGDEKRRRLDAEHDPHRANRQPERDTHRHRLHEQGRAQSPTRKLFGPPGEDPKRRFGQRSPVAQRDTEEDDQGERAAACQGLGCGLPEWGQADLEALEEDHQSDNGERKADRDLAPVLQGSPQHEELKDEQDPDDGRDAAQTFTQEAEQI